MASRAVGGDSAGGGLALPLAGELKRTGEELPGCLWLVSPWTDLTMSARPSQPKAPSTRLSIRTISRSSLARTRLPGPTGRTRAYRRSPQLSRVCRRVGSAETLLDDAVRLAEAAGAADVFVTFEA